MVDLAHIIIMIISAPNRTIIICLAMNHTFLLLEIIEKIRYCTLYSVSAYPTFVDNMMLVEMRISRLVHSTMYVSGTYIVWLIFWSFFATLCTLSLSKCNSQYSIHWEPPRRGQLLYKGRNSWFYLSLVCPFLGLEVSLYYSIWIGIPPVAQPVTGC